MDVARLAGADPRLRVVFTARPGPAGTAAEALLRDAGALVVPWQDTGRGDFGLVITATAVPGPAPPAPQIVLPAAAEVVRRHMTGQPSPAPQAPPGRVPVTIALAHGAEERAPAIGGPPDTWTVVGDSIHDRLVASLPLRDFYRRAFGIGGGQRLVVAVLPACGGHGACADGPCRCVHRSHEVVRRLLDELPSDGYRVLGVPELGSEACMGGPGLAGPLRNGLGLMPPDADWRAAVVAADWVIGGSGPIIRYATITGAPVVLTTRLSGSHGSGYAQVARVAPCLSVHHPMQAQLREAAEWWRPERGRPVVEGITSAPGRFDRNMRRLMYKLLRLSQPATIPVADPVSPPFRIEYPAELLTNLTRGG
ncbi:hypothetical protein [Actinomadura macra]|uniref:hypothetical protein n=1 Tax=Actinomadura macra TaxID=46164 RepID=UPI0008365FC0|nr:hypothetical protein [Actinomadura macra]